MLQRRIIILLILGTSLLGGASFFSILHYLNPYGNMLLAVSLLIVSFFLFFSGGITVILYFIKKIYYRGDVGMLHVFSSLRQCIFLGIFIIGVYAFYSLGLPLVLASFALAGICISLEFFIKNV